MAGMTSFLQKKLLDHFLNFASYTAATTLWLSLHTASPTDTGSHANEVSKASTGYLRQVIVLGTVDAVNGTTVNTGVITIGPATADWGIITYLGVEDAAGAISPDVPGNMCMWGVATTAKLVVIGENYQLVIGQLSIRFD